MTRMDKQAGKSVHSHAQCQSFVIYKPTMLRQRRRQNVVENRLPERKTKLVGRINKWGKADVHNKSSKTNRSCSLFKVYSKESQEVKHNNWLGYIWAMREIYYYSSTLWTTGRQDQSTFPAWHIRFWKLIFILNSRYSYKSIDTIYRLPS